jgi:hypothetical protein
VVEPKVRGERTHRLLIARGIAVGERHQPVAVIRIAAGDVQEVIRVAQELEFQRFALRAKEDRS